MSPPGTKVYQENLAEYMRLRRYERLLNVQHVHYWRQIAVRNVSVKWVWLPAGDASLRIVYQIDDWGLDAIADMPPVVPRAENSSPTPIQLKVILAERAQELCDDADCDIMQWLANDNRSPLREGGKDDHLYLWAIQVRDDVILSEHKSQKAAETDGRCAYVRFLPDGVAFEVATSGRMARPLSPGKEVLLLERKDFV